MFLNTTSTIVCNNHAKTTCYAISFLVKVIHCIIFPSYLMVTESYRSNEYNIHMFGTIIVCSIDQIFLVYLYTGVYSAGREVNECIRYAVCPNHNLYRTHHIFVSNIRNTMYCKLKYISSCHILHNIQHTTYIQYKKQNTSCCTAYNTLYTILQHLSGPVQYIAEHTTFCIMHTLCCTPLLYNTTYNIQQFEHHATHCTLFCSTYKLYIHVILCSMQHSVQHTLYCTTHCRIQCTKYKMLNIMQTLYTIMQHIQHPVQDIGEHLTCCMHNVCKIMYNVLYNTMHKIQHT